MNVHPFLSGPAGLPSPAVSTNLPPHPRRAEAEKLLREGKYPREVAETVGASLRAVARWRSKLELPALPRPGRSAGAEAQGLHAEAVRMLEERRAAGAPERKVVSEIARALGVTGARIRQIRAELAKK